MKNLLSLFIAVIISASAFAQTNMNIHKTDGSTLSISIADIDSVTYTSVPPIVGGEFDNPIDVATAIANNTPAGVWVQGFIVGNIEVGAENLANLSAPFTTNSNIYIAPTASETDTTKMLIVQIGGDIRTETNLVDNGSLLGLEIKYKGNLESYFTVAGLKSTTGYWLIGADTGINPDYVAPGTIYAENFSSITASYDPITTMTIIMQDGTKDWHGDGYNGQSAEASAYDSGEDLNKTWLITPAIDLTSTTAPKLSFYSALKYFAGDLLTVLVCTDFNGTDPSVASWSVLTTDIVTDSDPVDGASGFNFRNTVDIDLSSYTSSSTVYIAWFYNGSGNSGTTTKYRIDDITIIE